MKFVSASSLALALSCLILPAAQAQSDGGALTATSELGHQVRAALARNGVSLSHVFVLTRSSEVMLVGWVPAPEQVFKAEQIASTVPGVSSVSNQLAPDAGPLR